MSQAILSVLAAGPQISIQDAGRVRWMRYGIPASGPMDRLSFAAANTALGNPANAAGLEVSLGGLTLACVSGTVGFATAGGGFAITHADQPHPSWGVGTLRPGQQLRIQPGPWGSWCYLTFAGVLQTNHWLGSAATHAPSGLGGGALAAGQTLTIQQTRQPPKRHGAIPVPHLARPRTRTRITMGPQQRFFDHREIMTFLSHSWNMTSARDRMGARLKGPAIMPAAQLDMPSEPVLRGSIQVAGDGVPTVLLADHPTTGGYPKIATLLDCELDVFAQLRPGQYVSFEPVTHHEAVRQARNTALRVRTYLKAISR